MTDTILVDQDGHFKIGKAATTPQNEAEGFLASAEDAADAWGISLEDLFSGVNVVLYSGTGMLNTLLSRTGRRLGLITTKGLEDMILMGRGLQAWADYSYADRLHAVTHHHPDPLVPRRRTHGVTERIDQFGDIVLPLYEHEVVTAAKALIKDKVDAICIMTIFSHVNPAHEKRIAAICREEIAKAGAEINVYTSHEVRPGHPRAVAAEQRADRGLCHLARPPAAEGHRGRLEEIRLQIWRADAAVLRRPDLDQPSAPARDDDLRPDRRHSGRGLCRQADRQRLADLLGYGRHLLRHGRHHARPDADRERAADGPLQAQRADAASRHDRRRRRHDPQGRPADQEGQPRAGKRGRRSRPDLLRPRRHRADHRRLRRHPRPAQPALFPRRQGQAAGREGARARSRRNAPMCSASASRKRPKA